MEIVVFSNVFEGDLTLEIDDLEVVEYITDKLCKRELENLYERKENLERVGSTSDPSDVEDMEWIDSQIKDLKTMMEVEDNGKSSN